MTDEDWDNLDLHIHALAIWFRPLVMFWESSEKTYREVDMAVNPANITWARIWVDIQHLENVIKTERLSQEELCDNIFQKKLSENHPKAMPLAWKMAVNFETPYQYDNEVDEDELKFSTQGNEDKGQASQEGILSCSFPYLPWSRIEKTRVLVTNM